MTATDLTTELEQAKSELAAAWEQYRQWATSWTYHPPTDPQQVFSYDGPPPLGTVARGRQEVNAAQARVSALEQAIAEQEAAVKA